MLLELKDFGIEFHDHDRPERVVENVSFSLDEGDILGIVGESGSGKSMTALAIAGLLPRKKLIKEGEILFEGRDVLRMARRELRELQGDEISMIFQEPMTALNPTMRTGRQIEESLRIHHPDMDKEARKKLALEWIENVEMKDPERVYYSYPHELSGGMRQRVMIAAAMVAGPRLLIADEPTTALDVTVQAQIMKLLLKINKQKKVAILFISHDLSLIKQISHRVVVMHKGRIEEMGDTEQIFERPGTDYTKRLIEAIPEVVL
jgi:ABC-type dipeptide/oligopeptide/nickel transport system ATPase component